VASHLTLQPVGDTVTDRVSEKLRRELGETLCRLLTEPDVVEIMLNPDGGLWVERLGVGMSRLGTMRATQAESLINTVAAMHRTSVTTESPILECQLPIDGSRFEALVPPVVERPVFTIRRRASRVFPLTGYVAEGIMQASQADVLRRAVSARDNILVVGGTGSGKTTLTNALIAEVATVHPHHRLVILEDTPELQCQAENAVLVRTTDTVSMGHLLKATMRLRPDRIIVGEVRGPEALTLLKAWNTGHPGGVATLHANHAMAGLTRLEQLIAEATPAPMRPLIAEAVDWVVFIANTPHGRRVLEVLAVEGLSVDGTYCVSAARTAG
jgi:type IV secretion system protein TrbB